MSLFQLFSHRLYSDQNKELPENVDSLEAYDLTQLKEYAVKTQHQVSLLYPIPYLSHSSLTPTLLQLCIFCNEPHATLCCHNRTCNRRFHFKCGFDSEKVLFKFNELFLAYCPRHGARNNTTKPGVDDSCAICLTELGEITSCGLINLHCRPYVWIHRNCALRLASYRGYEFQCPLCGDLKSFQKYICLRGVFIPQRDTLTQAHNVAYRESQTKFCEAEICLQSKSRDARAEDKLLSNDGSSTKCGYCGKTFHTECGLKQGTFTEPSSECGGSFTCSSCMTLSEHELSVSSEEENELNAGFDYGSDCSGTSEQKATQEAKGEEEETETESQMVKRFKFEHHYQWQPCRGYHNKDWRQFKLNLFMNTLRSGGLKRSRDFE